MRIWHDHQVVGEHPDHNLALTVGEALARGFIKRADLPPAAQREDLLILEDTQELVVDYRIAHRYSAGQWHGAGASCCFLEDDPDCPNCHG